MVINKACLKCKEIIYVASCEKLDYCQICGSKLEVIKTINGKLFKQKVTKMGDRINQRNSFPCKKCGITYSEESGAYEGFICENCTED